VRKLKQAGLARLTPVGPPRDAAPRPPPPRLRTTDDPGARDASSEGGRDDPGDLRLWITAVLTMAAMALMVGLTVAAQAGVHEAHPNPPVAGLSFNGH
jgi:hypothetical protein